MYVCMYIYIYICVLYNNYTYVYTCVYIRVKFAYLHMYSFSACASRVFGIFLSISRSGRSAPISVIASIGDHPTWI